MGIGCVDEDIETPHIDKWFHKLFLLSELTGYLTTHICCKIFVFYFKTVLKHFQFYRIFFLFSIRCLFFPHIFIFFSFLDHGHLLSCLGDGNDSKWGGGLWHSVL